MQTVSCISSYPERVMQPILTIITFDFDLGALSTDAFSGIGPIDATQRCKS